MAFVVRVDEHSALFRYRYKDIHGAERLETACVFFNFFICVTSDAQKDMMMQQILKRWGFEASNNDEADAYALARVGDSIINPDRYTKEQMKSALTFKNL